MKAVAAMIAIAGPVLAAAACGGSPASRVTTTRSPTSQPLAFSRCMRSNGVPGFPDPDSSGVWPKSQVELVAGDPRFQAATRACGHLLPDGGPGVAPSPATQELIRTDMLKFARCMRSHGVPDWPALTLDRGRPVFDPEAVGIDVDSPRVGSTMRDCEHVFPASLGRPPGT